jgi:hypothetical protein
MNSIATNWRTALFALFLIAGISVLATDSSAQGRVTNYAVSNIGTGFTPIAGTYLTNGDDVTGTITLPFDFNYDNTSYSAGTGIRANTNGWVEFGTSVQPGGSPYADRVAPSYVYPSTIYIWSNDQFVVGGIYYTTLGSAPNRIFVIEWNNIRGYNSGNQTHMQVRLYETSYNIELHYANYGISMNTSSSVGLHGGNSPSFVYQRIYGSSYNTPQNNYRCVPPIPPGQQLSVTPKSINFGSVVAGVPSATYDVIVRNSGKTTNLVISSAALTGASDYQIVSSPATNVYAPGEQGVYKIRLTPNASGARNASFNVVSNGIDSGTQSVTLTGIGIAPQVTFQDLTTLFRKTRTKLGESISATTVIKSTGNGPLSITSITIDGEFANNYSITRMPSLLLPAGTQDSVTVTYSPREEGLRAAILNIQTNAIQNPNKAITLNGLGILPHLSITPSVVKFDSVAMGDTAWTTLRLYNPGSDTLAVKADYVTYFDRDFAYFGLEGADSLIAPETFREVLVRFTPQSQGARQGRVRFLTNIPLTFETPRRDTSIYIIDVMGTAVPYGLISIAGPTMIDSAIIGNQICRTVKISNNGQSPLTITSAAISGPEASDFTITGITFPKTIAAGGSVDIQICGTPSARGLRMAVVDVMSTSNERATTTQLPLAVYGLSVCAQPSTNVAFENEIILVNTSSTAQVMINNCGDVPTAYTASINGTGYTLTSAATTGMIAPGDNATFDVSFNPTTMGALPATLLVTGQGVPDMPIQLAGTGGNVMIAAANNTAPETGVGLTSAEFTVSVTNTGNMELTPGNLSINNTEFAMVGSGPATIAAGASADYKFTFSPSAEGNRTAAVSFPSASPTLQGGFMLNGKGIILGVRPVAANGYSLGQNYPNPFAGQSAITFTMAEAGNAQIIVSDVTGNAVTVAANQFFNKGENTVTFDASNMASGTYFYELVANGTRLQRSMLLSK